MKVRTNESMETQESNNKRNMQSSSSCHRVTTSRTDPGVTSEFACDLSCSDVPQDHRLIRAAGAQLAVVIGTVGTAKEKHTLLSQHSTSLY